MNAARLIPLAFRVQLKVRFVQCFSKNFCNLFQMMVTANPHRDLVQKGCVEPDALFMPNLERLTQYSGRG